MKELSPYRDGMRQRILLQATGLLLLLPALAMAQQGSQGNTTIFSGATMTFAGSHNFLTGGSGTQPGTIGTVRTAPYGILDFAPSAGTYTGANNANHVDGYIRKSGTGAFIFPVGNHGRYGPFAASADGTTGAYYFANPNTAVVPNPAGGNYPPLPAGAPFATTSRGAGLTSVSSVEYWDIDGAGSTTLTLTWSTGSGVDTLSGNALPNLAIAGWDGSKWVNIPATVDATSALGGASSLTSGSITTSAAITPDTYTAYTLASTKVILPITLLSFTALKQADAVLLNWETSDQVNFSHFEIQNSTGDLDNWAAIGTVAAKSASSLQTDYSFTHAHPVKGINQYRLKMIDLDGKYSYSPIRRIAFDGTNNTVIYPNPASDYINIQTGNPSAIASIRLSDWNGRSILSATLSSSDTRIDLKSIPPGIYVLTLFYQDGTKESRKISVKPP